MRLLQSVESLYYLLYLWHLLLLFCFLFNQENTKESFQCFYILVILFDSVYRKDGNYYPKVFLEKFIRFITFFGEV